MSKRSKNQCEEVRAAIAFYLDDELSGSDLAAFESHLESCASCSEMMASERRFIEGIREAKPLREAPPKLRSSVEQILSNSAPPYAAPPELRRRVRKSLSSPFHLSSRRRLIAVAAIFIFVVALASVWYTTKFRSQKLPSEFALMAVDTHLRHLRGQLPFEIATDSPDDISRWFAGKVSFTLQLPNYQEASGQEKLYRLEGARL